MDAGLEAAAAGIATAIYGPDDVIVMGPSAARLHGAIPRALATATIAVPSQHRESHCPTGRRSSGSSNATPPAWTPNVSTRRWVRHW